MGHPAARMVDRTCAEWGMAPVVDCSLPRVLARFGLKYLDVDKLLFPAALSAGGSAAHNRCRRTRCSHWTRSSNLSFLLYSFGQRRENAQGQPLKLIDEIGEIYGVDQGPQLPSKRRLNAVVRFVRESSFLAILFYFSDTQPS